jgi:hypothetical protein
MPRSNLKPHPWSQKYLEDLRRQIERQARKAFGTNVKVRWK